MATMTYSKSKDGHTRLGLKIQELTLLINLDTFIQNTQNKLYLET
jgi:hypothetical protein